MSELIVFVLVVAAGLAWRYATTRERPARFRQRPIMTGTGLEFMFRLQRALPECSVCPQVAATSLLEPLGTGGTRKAALARIVGRRVGYVLFDQEMQLIAVVELDHRPRLTRREAECDGYFRAAGIPTLRFHPKRLPSEAQIRASVFPRGSAEASPIAVHGAASDGPLEFKSRGAVWRNTIAAHN